MIKEYMWVLYSVGAIVGLLGKDDVTNSVKDSCRKAGEVADEMIDQYRNRFRNGWDKK